VERLLAGSSLVYRKVMESEDVRDQAARLMKGGAQMQEARQLPKEEADTMKKETKNNLKIPGSLRRDWCRKFTNKDALPTHFTDEKELQNVQATPSDVRENATKDLVSQLKAEATKIKKDPRHTFDLYKYEKEEEPEAKEEAKDHPKKKKFKPPNRLHARFNQNNGLHPFPCDDKSLKRDRRSRECLGGDRVRLGTLEHRDRVEIVRVETPLLLAEKLPFQDTLKRKACSNGSHYKQSYPSECSIFTSHKKHKKFLMIPHDVEVSPHHTELLESVQVKSKKSNIVQIAPTPAAKIIALDPGVRSFLTGFTGDFCHVNFLPDLQDDIKALFARADKQKAQAESLKQKIDAKEFVPKSSMKQHQGEAIHQRLWQNYRSTSAKITHRVEQMHILVAKYLTENFDVIILPCFATSQMIRCEKSVLRNATRRLMGTLSHYKFRIRLIEQATTRGAIVLSIGEEYTTKTCASCLMVGKPVGGSKKFTCTSCGFTVGRDVNGAINILQKFVAGA
jgi:putative transposase